MPQIVPFKALVECVSWVFSLHQHFYRATTTKSSVSEKGPIQIPGVPPAGECAEMNPESLVNIPAFLQLLWNGILES